MGLVKWAAAVANRDLGRLTGSGKSPLSDAQVEALLAACREVAEGRFDAEFPIDVYQTGSGTSSNMNVNEVIAARAVELTGGDRLLPERPIHPNDHVNMGQSTNDTFPTAIHVAAAREIGAELIPALERCRDVLARKAAQWQDVLKIGRTHLADATPLSPGPGNRRNGTAAWSLSVARARRAHGGGAGVAGGRHGGGKRESTRMPSSARRVCRGARSRKRSIPFVEAADHFEANAQRDGLVECHGRAPHRGDDALRHSQ